MGKRGVIRQLLSWRKQAPVSPAPAAERAAAARFETLEGRQLLSAAVDPIVNITWNGQKMSVFQNRYVVEFQPGANLDKLAKESQFTDIQSLGSGYYSLRAPKNIAQMEKWAANRPGAVVVVAPDVVIKPTDIALPNDPYFGDQWQYYNTGQVVPNPQFDPTGSAAYLVGSQAGTVGADIGSADAWSIVTGDPYAGDPSKQIVVAVFDTGIDLTHPDLVNNIWTNPYEIPGNNIDDDGDGYVDDVHGYDFFQNDADVTDDFGHGTHVSGIIGASGNNGLGVTGVIQNVKILPVRVTGAGVAGSVAFGALSSFIHGIEYVTMLKNRGVNIVAGNASLGYTQVFGSFPFNRILNDAVARLGDAGVLLVAAAGNDSLDLDPTQTFPGKFSLNQPNVITVAATDNQDNIAFFSNIGTSVQIAAPGVNILSTLPTYDLATLQATGEIVPSTENIYGYESGTSMAAPMVAGAIALMKAAKPDASAMELKAALLSGADYISALDKPISSGSPLVSTSGRLNVNKAILNLLNQRTNVDTYTRGSWVGAYGKDGAVVYGDTGVTDYTNSFVTARVSGAILNVVADTSKDLDALQQQSNHSSRLAAQLTAAGPITLDLDFTGTASHRVSLYQADLDGRAGKQTITLIDPDTGDVIATYTTGNLQTGEYQTFEINPPTNSDGTLASSYRVRMVITPSTGSNAVLNGLFFDPATTNDAALVTPTQVAGVTTTTTGGEWRDSYGSNGAKIFGAGSTLGYGLTVTGGKQVVKGQFRKKDAALIAPKGTNDKQRVAGYVQTTSSMDIRLNLGSGDKQLTIYAADFEKLGRAERLDLYNDETGALISSADLSDFSDGKYVSWIASGKVRVHVTKLAGPTAVVSGVFVDAAPGAPIQYVGMDTTSSGNWRTYYGADASIVIGSDDAPVRRNTYTADLATGYTLPDVTTPGASATVSFTNGGTSVPHTVLTGDSRYLLVPGSTTNQRVANAKSTGNSMNLDIKFTDQDTHTVAIYMVDPDKKGKRAQRVELQLIDPTTGKAYTVASQIVSGFGKGKYVVFNAKQINADVVADVRVKISRVTGPSAVVSGVFFG